MLGRVAFEADTLHGWRGACILALRLWCYVYETFTHQSPTAYRHTVQLVPAWRGGFSFGAHKMSRRFKVFNDSGANIHSKYETTTSLEELGIEEAVWDGMTEEERDEAMRDVAFQQAGWGYFEVDENGSCVD